jgi:hypothetical protein
MGYNFAILCEKEEKYGGETMLGRNKADLIRK